MKKKYRITSIFTALTAVLILITSCNEGAPLPRDYMIYMKDEQVYYTDFGSGKDHKLTEDFYWNVSYTPTVSEDGNIVLVADDTKKGDEFTNLYAYNVSKEQKTLVCEKAKIWYLSTDGRYVTALSEDGIICSYDTKKETFETISENADGLHATEDGKTVLFKEDGSHLYIKRAGKDKVLIDTGLRRVISYLEGRKEVYYITTGECLYKAGVNGKPKLIAQGVNTANVLETGEVFYTTLGRDTPIYEFVEDDYAEQDSNYVFPERPSPDDFETQEQWREAVLKYDENNKWEVLKQSSVNNRNDMRSVLKREVIKTERAIYFYDGKESLLIMENVVSGTHDFNEDKMGVIEVLKNENVPVTKLSELGNTEEFCKSFKRAYSDLETEKYFYCENNVSRFEKDNIKRVKISKDGKELCYIADHIDKGRENTGYEPGDLYTVPILDGKLGKAALYDTGVSSAGYNSDGEPVYQKSVIRDERYYKGGPLYVGNKTVGNNVTTFFEIYDETLCGYLFYDTVDGVRALKSYKDGKETRIADCVTNYTVTEDGRIVYLAEYTGAPHAVSFTLGIWENGKNTVISDKVFKHKLLPSGDIVCIKFTNDTQTKMALYHYKDGELIKHADGVKGFLYEKFNNRTYYGSTFSTAQELL
ncbi:MAG: hypothetical protein IJ408_05250 [Clostridia bacterium]|nr:hypothetical protein [Clostridia bacterium]